MHEDAWSEYEAVVESRWQYYAPRFERFARGEWLSWNWAAFLATLAWLRYRKLYAWSWAYFFVSAPLVLAFCLIVVMGGDTCERALDPVPDVASALTLLASPFLFLQWILLPLVANRLYFNRVRAQTGRTKRVTGTGGYVGALALQAFGLIGIAAIAPTSESFFYRHMVYQGLSMAEAAKVPLQNYYSEHQRLPLRLDEATDQLSSKFVERLVLDSDGTIQMIFGNESRKLSGHSVSIVPEMKDGRIVNWTCQSSDLPNICLPHECRRAP